MSRPSVRDFRFFFWLSASLFILAGANWLFNDFIGISNVIGISGPASYLLGIGVLILAIFLVASILSMAYHGVPQVREILDGLLGLERHLAAQSSPTQSQSTTTSGQEPEFDREIELKRLDLVSEEHRTRYYTALGVYFSILAGIIAALIAFSFNLSLYTVTLSSSTVTSVSLVVPSLISFAALLALAIVGILVALVTFRTVRQYREQLTRLDMLVEDIRRGRSIGSMEEALRRIINAPR